MVECEFCLYSTEWQLSGVLIDTWWNVNDCACLFLQNVVRSFNRYMVECECKAVNVMFKSGTCFNRYMVECEYLQNQTGVI